MQLWRYGQPIESLNNERYTIEGMLGSGGMAEVWKAYDEDETRDVALKLLNPQFSDQEMMNRFVKEAGQIVGWQHPHILKIYDHMQVERFDANHFLFYIVMEYANGGDLQSRLTPGKPYSLRATFTLMRQLCDAVAYAHRHGVIHRDIKPPNVLFRRPRTGPEEVVLSDFGLAVQVDASHHTFADGGTPVYMAPEQFQGQAEPASDIFALGVLLYQLCTGELPFRRSSHPRDLSFLARERETPPLSPSTLNPALPSIFNGVILCALEPEPADRYRSADEFWKTITIALRKSVLPSEQRPSHPSRAETQQIGKRTHMVPERASRPGPKRNPQTIQLAQSHPNHADEKGTVIVPRSSRQDSDSVQAAKDTQPRRISRRLLIGTGIGASALVVAGGGTLLLSHVWSPMPKLHATATTSGQTYTPTSTTPTETPSPAPTHTTAPVSLTAPLYSYKGHQSSISSLSWSPDGTRIASSDDGNGQNTPATVQVWEATSGQHRMVVDTETNNAGVTSVAWSPTGKMIAWGSSSNKASFWDVSTEKIDDSYPFTVSPDTIAWSPDGTRVAVGLYDNTIHVWNPRLGTGSGAFILRGHTQKVNAVAWSPDGSKIASGADDKTVRVWNASNGQPLFTYTAHSAPVTSLCWSPDSTRIASVNGPPITGPISPSNEGTAHVWNATSGASSVTHRTEIGNTISWSPVQPNYLACDDYDGTSAHYLIDIWDVRTGKTVATCDNGPTNQALVVAWSPKSGLLASGGNDSTIQVWNPFP